MSPLVTQTWASRRDTLERAGGAVVREGHAQKAKTVAKKETPMNIHEYQAKQIFARYGVPVPRGEVAFTVAEVGPKPV